MYISENDLKRRLLTAQIEILNQVVSELRRSYELTLAETEPVLLRRMRMLYKSHSEQLTELKREREKLKPVKVVEGKLPKQKRPEPSRLTDVDDIETMEE